MEAWCQVDPLFTLIIAGRAAWQTTYSHATATTQNKLIGLGKYWKNSRSFDPKMIIRTHKILVLVDLRPDQRQISALDQIMALWKPVVVIIITAEAMKRFHSHTSDPFLLLNIMCWKYLKLYFYKFLGIFFSVLVNRYKSVKIKRFKCKKFWDKINYL